MKLMRSVMLSVLVCSASGGYAMDDPNHAYNAFLKKKTASERLIKMDLSYIEKEELEAVRLQFQNIKMGEIYMAESNQYSPIASNDPNSPLEVDGPKVLRIFSHKDEDLSFLDKNKSIFNHYRKRMLCENTIIRIYNMEAQGLIEKAIKKQNQTPSRKRRGV